MWRQLYCNTRKGNIYAIKKDEVILQGKLNQSDGLWDIPIHKNTIQEETYAKPQSHGLTYAVTKNNHIQQYIRTNKQKKEKKNFFHIFMVWINL